MFRFYWPYVALLLPLPLFLRKKKKPIATIRFPFIERLKSAFPSQLRQYKGLNTFFILLYLSWFGFVLALMQPERVEQFKISSSSSGYDLMLAVDISASMQALDFSTRMKKVSRLDVTKEVVSRFVLGRAGDRVGLITFGEHAYLHVPLTLDTKSASRMLQDIVAGMAGNATAIGDAVGLAVRTLRERPEHSRVLILLTDGEDNASSIPPLEAAKLAKQYGIRIYTIGVGTNGFGYSIDEALLKEIATMTGGEYFLATNPKALQTIYDKIDSLEKSEVEGEVYFIREPLYYYPLALAMILLFALTLHQMDRRLFSGS